jgi:filamentous hemagglutinin family protein
MSAHVTICPGTVGWDASPQGHRPTRTVRVAPSRWPAIMCRTMVWSSAWLLLLTAVSRAQVTTTITPDGTLGTEVSQNGPVHEITGGTRPAAGSNLFHSFDRFDVGTGDTAHFIGQPGIDNIIGRVTGPEASVIDGKLQSDAGLYLLNPQGMMFGPNATLDINGSFYASTADVLRFADGAEFSTRLSAKSSLTVESPAAFGFLNDNPSGIQVEGSKLALNNGTLSIVGGDIRIEGGASIAAPGGQVNVVSVASRGEAVFDPAQAQPDVAVSGLDQLGTVKIVDGSEIDVLGTDGGGKVSIRGGRLLIDSALVQGGTIEETGGNRIGIDIDISDEVALNHGAILGTKADTAGRHAGDIEVTTGNLRMEDVSLVTSETVSEGDAGALVIKAKNIQLSSGAQIGNATFGPGQGETVLVEAQHVRLSNGAQIISGTLGQGGGGTVTVRATEVILEGEAPDHSFPTGIFVDTQGEGEGAGNAGAMVVEAQHVHLSGGAQISGSTFGLGNGGTVTVRATEVILEGGTADNRFGTGIFAGTEGEGEGAGNAGAIVVEAQRVRLSGRAQISGSTFGLGQGGTVTVRATEITLEGASPDNPGPTGIFAGTEGEGEGAGDAGAIVIEAQHVRITGGAQIGSSTFGSGQGGTITVTAAEVILEGMTPDNRFPAGIFANALADAEGDAGAIVIEAQHVRITGGAQIASRTLGPGHGGTVTVTAAGALTVSGQGGLFANTTGTGQGGDIILRDSQLLLTDGATISARSSGQGNAGNIRIAATDLTFRNHGEITTEAAQAGGGNIEIEAQTVRMVDSDITATVSSGERQGGNIRIGGTTTANGDIVESLGRLSLEGSRISANTDAGDGANIAIGARQVILDHGSEIAANTKAGVGGNVTMASSIAADGQALSRAGTIVLRGSQVTAKAQKAQGGRIDSLPDAFLADPASSLDASSQEGGIDGEVNVEAVVSNLSEVVRPLSQRLAPDTPLLRDRCAARLHQGLVSSFVERERSGIASSPEGLLPARLDTRAAEGLSSGGSLPHGMAMASEPSWRLQSRCP